MKMYFMFEKFRNLRNFMQMKKKRKILSTVTNKEQMK